MLEENIEKVAGVVVVVVVAIYYEKRTLANMMKRLIHRYVMILIN
jgi:hypothetical protein